MEEPFKFHELFCRHSSPTLLAIGVIGVGMECLGRRSRGKAIVAHICRHETAAWIVHVGGFERGLNYGRANVVPSLGVNIRSLPVGEFVWSNGFGWRSEEMGFIAVGTISV